MNSPQDAVVFNRSSAEIVKQTVQRVWNEFPTETTGNNRRRLPRPQGFWAKVAGHVDDPSTTGGGFFYNFTEQYWKNTAWVDKPDGRTGNLADGSDGIPVGPYAINAEEWIVADNTEADAIQTGTIVWIQAGFDTTGAFTWVMSQPFGITGAFPAYGLVKFAEDSSGIVQMVQDRTINHYQNGLVIHLDPTDQVPIADTIDCSAA